MCEDGNACLLTLSVPSVHDYMKLHSFVPLSSGIHGTTVAWFGMLK